MGEIEARDLNFDASSILKNTEFCQKEVNLIGIVISIAIKQTSIFELSLGKKWTYIKRLQVQFSCVEYFKLGRIRSRISFK